MAKRSRNTNGLEQLLNLGRKKAQKTLPVFIVDDHNEVLDALYKGIRRGLLPFDGLSMVHFDAHPDMSAPKELPANLVFSDPEEYLHKLRNSDTGIADWILPFVYGGHLNKLIWVKPPWSDQIMAGKYDFFVGATCPNDEIGYDTLFVSCPQAYWKEENAYVPEYKLKNKQRLDLDVVSLPLESCHLPSNFSKSGYILDVCLDYFSTNNPFYEEIVGILPKTGLLAVENLYRFLSKIINKKCIHSNKQRNIDGSPNESTSIDNTAKYEVDGHIDFIAYLFDASTISQEDPCATDPAFELIFHEISDQLCYDNEDLVNQNSAGCGREKQTSSSLKSNFVEAVRQFLNVLRALPQDKYATLKECFTMLGLPKHKSSKSEMRQLLQNFEKYLAFLQTQYGDPKLVTIACSSTDGFTPAPNVHWILKNVLEKLKVLYGRRLDLIFEYDINISI